MNYFFHSLHCILTPWWEGILHFVAKCTFKYFQRSIINTNNKVDILHPAVDLRSIIPPRHLSQLKTRVIWAGDRINITWKIAKGRQSSFPLGFKANQIWKCNYSNTFIIGRWKSLKVHFTTKWSIPSHRGVNIVSEKMWEHDGCH